MFHMNLMMLLLLTVGVLSAAMGSFLFYGNHGSAKQSNVAFGLFFFGLIALTVSTSALGWTSWTLPSPADVVDYLKPYLSE